MNAKGLICLIFHFLLVGFCLGQDLNPDIITKIKVYTSEGSFGGGTNIEVVKENDVWKSYLVRHSNGFKTDTNRQLIRNVPDSIIAHLVTVFNKPDSEPVLNHYQLDFTLLPKYADSIKVGFKPNQKAEFIKALLSTPVLKSALIKVAQPADVDHLQYSSMALVTKAGKIKEIVARSYAYMDYVFWQDGKTKYYNPDIHLIFNYFRLKDKENVGAKKRLYKSIAEQVYQSDFQTKFLWANFQTDHPTTFKLLTKKLKPINVVGNDKWIKAQFKVTGLPGYITFETVFKIDSIAEIVMINRQRDTIVNICRQAKFLMDHFKSQPGAKVVVYSENDGVHKPYFHFEMKSNQNNHSEWLAVDGKSLTLVGYSGYLKDPFSDKFEGIIPGKAYYNGDKRSNLVFDFKGNLIGGDKQVGHSDLVFE